MCSSKLVFAEKILPSTFVPNQNSTVKWAQKMRIFEEKYSFLKIYCNLESNFIYLKNSHPLSPF